MRARPLARLIAGGAGWFEWVLLFAAAVALAGGLLAARLTDPLDALIHDAIVRATPHSPDPRLLIVGIDDASIRALGRWPWSRSVHAQLIDRLSDAGAKAVGYDVLFVEPGESDAALAGAVSRSGKVALPLLLARPGDNGAAFRVTRPVVAAASAGHVVVRPDGDGVFRRIAPVETAGAESLPHLGLATALLAGPVSQTAGVLIPYAGPPGVYPTVSFAAVLHGEVPPELLRDRIVLVGATAAGLGDRFATPVGGTRDLMAGVEVQASIVDALRHSGLRSVAGFAACLAFAGCALALLWAGFMFAGPRENLVFAALIFAGVSGIAALVLVQGGVWIRPAAALVTLVVMFPLWGWRRLAAASRFLDAELDRLGGSDAPRPAGGDRLAHQIALLDAASDRMDMLRRQREETLAFLSHDLRSPAAAILGLVPEGDRIAGHARRLLRLADQFVQGLRAEEAPLIIEPVELAALLDEAADQCWEAAQRVGGRVTVEASWDIPEISTDRQFMARAVVNLIDNALKYGGEQPHVEVRGWSSNGRALVTVADRGPGMSPDHCAALFRRFERVGASRPDGVGLGLALVSTFARRQEGEVSCVSRERVGTLFELSIPLL
ncbi:CHASE2 and HATPase_c domain-containing protein [Sphingomonas sp. SUN039]|uniref:CHASE2 domain-containing protein n=1 Tax=Sphingomonas sp. SUN039 TaxID=2937787 RepID=UPI0021643EF2|nr:CHASE2 and HATPase_c domain-containing protein [Sphingomonas sp. SUN039]UVO54607.1 CHASE2 and HATPase_c domain-containing protein [Sphingomonas sp. SUN039]